MSKIDDDLKTILAQKPEQGQPEPRDPSLSEYAPLTDEALQSMEAEAELEKQFGGRGGEAFAGSAASAATLGLSDVALRGMGVSAERLSEVRERSPISSALGTGTGIVAPLVMSGGAAAPVQATGITAKAVLAAKTAAQYSPINLATKGGKAVEHFAADALKSRVRSKAAKEILSKATGMAAEGVALAEGNLVSEAALGRADLNGENVIASAGAGALLGAGFGTVFGAASASIPMASKVLKPLGSKLNGHVDDFTNPATSMQEVSGLTGKQQRNILRRNPKFFDEAVTYTNTELEHGVLTTPKAMYESNLTALKRNGTAVSKTIDELHGAATGHPTLSLSRDAVYGGKLRDGILKELRESLSGTAEVSAEKLKVIDNFDELLERYRKKNAPMDLKELDNLRKDLQKIKYKFNGTEVHNNKADVAEALRGGIREVIDETARRVGAGTQNPGLKDIAARLERANKNFSIGSTLEPGLYWRMTRGGNNLKFMDIIEGAAAQSIMGPAGLLLTGAKKVLSSDLRRNFMILTDMQRQATATTDLIKKSVSAFVSKSRKPASSMSLNALTGSGYGLSPANKAPKTRQEAFKNIAMNLNELQTSPDLLQTRLIKSTARIANAAPAIAQEMQQTLVKATQFLAVKLPRPFDSGSGEMFQREYQPTSMELAKFERYLQAVEHPLTILDDLEKGTLTAEHVEALKAVYPALYGQLQQQVLDQVASPEGQEMSYSKKVTLGILLDIPTDESLQGYSILALQSNFLPAEEPEMGPSGAKKSINTSKMESAGRAQTDVERIASRKA